jgi:hypothetical protein
MTFRTRNRAPKRSGLLGRSSVRTGINRVISTISVHPVGNVAHYVPTFQNWEVGPEPSCTAIGTYSACLVSGPQVWTWTEQTIGRTRNTQSRGQNP